MNHKRALGFLFVLATASTAALAEDGPSHRPAPPEAAQLPANSGDGAALPGLPLFKLPAQASDSARLHVGLAHARRDSHRAEHTRNAHAGAAAPRAPQGTAHRAAAAAHQKTAQSHLAAARERRAAAQARRDMAERRKAEAQDRREHAQERRAAAARQRETAAERQLNADALRAATEERRASATK